MTGRISMTSSSESRSSCVASVSLRITSTDSATTSSSRSSWPTFFGARTSSSRLGLRSSTFMGAPRIGPATGLLDPPAGDDLEGVAGLDRGAIQDLFLVACEAAEDAHAAGHDTEDEPPA